MKRIDLHVHTTASDGTVTPSEAVLLAKNVGLSAIAICDHDTAEGVAGAISAGKEQGVEVVPGIEISLDYKGHGIHLLGYFIDPCSPALRQLLAWVIEERKRRNQLILDAMRADGIGISFDWLEERFPGAVIGRPHFAAALAERGMAQSVDDAFRRYLSRGCRYYRKREYIPMDKAFEVIRAAGGKAVFAHPLQYRFPEDELLALTRLLADRGAVGMECLYSGYTDEQIDRLRSIAGRFGLCVTGGSDFHGSRKPHIPMGSDREIPYELLEKLKER